MRIAVIGLGSIGSRHARNLAALGHEVIGFDPVVRLEATCSRAETLMEALAQAQAAVVATPSSMHAEQAICALENDVPVLVEKPLSVDPEDSEKIVSLARARAVSCGVAMNLRFHPAIARLRQLIAEGTLGTIRYAQVSAGSDLRQWHPGSDYRTGYSARSALGGGVVRDSIHELDYLTWLLGPAVSVTAETGHVSDLEIDVEDLGLGLLRLASGALASIDLTYFDPVYRRGCLLVGSEATARWDWAKGTIEVSVPREQTRILAVEADVADTYVETVRDFVDAIAMGRPPRTTAEEGHEMVLLADTVLRAAREGRRMELSATRLRPQDPPRG
jgi:predicted dehydrogenase